MFSGSGTRRVSTTVNEDAKIAASLLIPRDEEEEDDNTYYPLLICL